MKRIALVSLLCMLALQLSAQSNYISIDSVKDNDTLIFFASNKSSLTQDVTLKITAAKNLNGYMDALTIRLLPNTTDVFHKLAVTGDYTYDFTYINSYPEETLVDEHLMIGGIKLNQGIVIFDKTNCGRCQKAKAFMLANSMPYQSMNITDNPEYKDLMWQVLSQQGYKGKSVQTPVFMVDGNASHSHKDLLGFLEGFK